MNQFRILAVAGALVTLVLFTTVLFQRGNDRPSSGSRPQDPVVGAIADLHSTYFASMKTAVSQSDVDCRRTPPSSRDPSCEDLVNTSVRLDPIVLDAISQLEMSLLQLSPDAEDDLRRGIQRNLELATSAHEFNAFLLAAWTESSQSKWDTAWSMWQSLMTRLGTTETSGNPAQSTSHTNPSACGQAPVPS